MTTFFLSAWLHRLRLGRQSAQRPSLSSLGQWDENRLPRFVRESTVALKYLCLLGPLDWDRFPDRPDQRFSLDCPPLPFAPLVAANLVKIDQHLPYLANLREYLVQHPAWFGCSAFRWSNPLPSPRLRCRGQFAHSSSLYSADDAPQRPDSDFRKT